MVQKYLDELKVIQATHVFLIFEKSLCQTNKPYKWAFLANSGRDPAETRLAMRGLILKSCDEILEDFSSSPEVKYATIFNFNLNAFYSKSYNKLKIYIILFIETS